MNWEICAVSKNEGNYIQEWAAYHKILGCQRIHLYDAASDDTENKLQIYIQEGFVNYIPWKVYPAQWQAYSNYIQNKKSLQDNTWTALIDIDEFILPMGEETVDAFLDSFNFKISAVGIGWHMFGNNHKYLRPTAHNGSIIRNYVSTEDYSVNHERMTKCFIRPLFCASSVRDPHYFDPIWTDYRVVREDGSMLKWGDHHHRSNEPFPTKRMRLNHYFTKSLEDWFVKLGRGAPDGNSRQLNDFMIASERCNSVQDVEILKFYDSLKLEMKRIGAWSL